MPLGLRARAAVFLLSGCTIFLLGANPAPAQGLLDANCPGPAPPGSGIVTSGNYRYAQTFAAQRTGDLVRGELEVNRLGGSGDWVMQVVATDDYAAPVNTVLASTTIADATVPAGDSRIAGLFAPPASVSAGHQYALLLTRPGSSWAVLSRNDNPCPGTYFFSTSQSSPWSQGGNPMTDIVFAVFVKPSNAFTLGGIQRNKKKGTASLTVSVPYAGDLALSGKGVKAAGATQAVAVTAPGNVKLLIKAKGKKRKTLNETGKVRVRPNITYTPTGGDPSSQSKSLKLKKLRKP
jgi:hypothetical protein